MFAARLILVPDSRWLLLLVVVVVVVVVVVDMQAIKVLVVLCTNVHTYDNIRDETIETGRGRD